MSKFYKVPVNKIKEFSRKLLSYLSTSKPESAIDLADSKPESAIDLETKLFDATCEAVKEAVSSVKEGISFPQD